MVQAFRLAGIDSPEADARVLLGAALRLTRAQLLSQSDRILEAREASATAALSARRIRREPVSRIIGEKEFWSLPLRVTPDVLVPRPETETLVEAALDEIDRLGLRAEKLKILDIGTGTGALLLALLSELTQAFGAASDISSDAIAIARENAERHKLAARCVGVVCSILSFRTRPISPAQRSRHSTPRFATSTRRLLWTAARMGSTPIGRLQLPRPACSGPAEG